jgi:regulator of protease activity HflC (stomatin/prohibitin superfamily)
MPDLVYLGLAAITTAIVIGSIAARLQTVTVYEYQRGLRFGNGRFEALVGPGRYRIWRPTTTIWVVDVRSTVAAITGQELVTSDGITVKISLAVQQRLADPVKAITEVEDYRDAAHSLIQIALREVVGVMSGDEVLAKRSEIGEQVLANAVEKVALLGVELISVDVRDLMLPSATKRLYSQVVEARQRGLAALEKARSETAALRSLANAASLVEKSPALLQLRLLQQLEGNTGNTFVLGTPAGISPIPSPRGAAPSGEEAGS